jgi:hypothetical protein
MRKLFYLGFCAVVAMSFGCAITNYGLITDNDQVYKDNCVWPACPATISTNGKAHLLEGSQVATTWSDGVDELMSFVDQKANGDRTITTYNNYSTFAGPWWHDDLYFNPDWNGCAIWTAPDPEVGDTSIFDGAWNQNCLGSRSLYYLVSQSRYYGECGKTWMNPDLSDRIAAMNYTYVGEFRGATGLFLDFSYDNTSMIVNGHVMPIPDGTAWLQPNTGHFWLDMTDPRMNNLRRAIHSAMPVGTSGTISLTWNGATFERDIYNLR